MASGTDIEYAIRRLKRAACDAKVMGPKRGIDSFGRIQGDVYTDGVAITVTRPDKDGEGGGVSLQGDSQYDYTTQFQDIRNWIESIVDRWRRIPDPKEIEKLRAKTEKIVESLTHHLGQYDAPGSIFSNLEVVYHELMEGDMNGNGIPDVDEGLRCSGVLLFQSFFKKFCDAVDACRQIAIAIHGAVDGEWEVWKAAELDAPQVIHRIAGRCERISHGKKEGETDFSGVVTVVEVALGTASVIPGPHQVVTGLSALGLTVVSTAVSKATEEYKAIEYVTPTPKPIPTYDKAIEVLDIMLNGLTEGVNSGVTTAESRIKWTLSWAIATIASKRSLFDPKPDPIVNVTPDTLSDDERRENEIFEHMNAVGAELNSTADIVHECLSFAGVLARGKGIGVCADSELYMLLELLEMLLRELSAEAYAGAANLRAAMEYLRQANAAAKAELDRLAQEFADADVSDFDSYDLSEHTPQALVEKEVHRLLNIFGMMEEG